MRCFIHLGGEDDEKVTQFTDKSWRKLCECAKAWCDATDSETINKCRLLADQIMKLLPMTDPPADAGCHRFCYASFCNEDHI